ncbi:hypothetical protein FQ087_20840 [Sporosarcina sp. ANT_H38]|uniref:hypothetical protein n=1 Tax=Sporosarcina sp. ANT_H38 TaxID=2597358 RepID=UPI0011F2ECA7|nr:hypothetical protein [Sporosarcina sp. ANT_H38]KAA0941607.1 hypothetical protein FQ087_20840 [Sporosarcina sp. ANT_H38]
MITIKNIKTLEDLKEEREILNNQLKHLKVNKSEQLHENTVNLLRSIQAYLMQFELDVRESNDNFHKGFVANYKNGFLRGEVKFNSNSLQIFFDGNVIETVEVLPKPTLTIYLQGISVEKDILSNAISDIDDEIKEIKDEIKAYEKLDIEYVVKGEDTNTTFLNLGDVLNHLIN